ncbi:hypothetical protein V8E54_008464 [Elaphomyces granulatus]
MAPLSEKSLQRRRDEDNRHVAIRRLPGLTQIELHHLSSLSESRPLIPSFLLQPPRRWTLEHLRTLKLIQQGNLSANAIIGAQNLPSDGDEEFEALATEFTKPTKRDLADFRSKSSIYRRNIFYRVFLRLSEVAKANDCSEPSKQAISTLFDALLSNIEGAENLLMHITVNSRIPFKLRSYGVQGALKCEGLLFRTTTINKAPLPVGTFSVVTDHRNSSITREVSQILLQGALGYDQNPTSDSHTAFVLRMGGTIFHLSMAVLPRIYMEELAQGKPLSENLKVFHSELYDLYELDRRKEALRLIIGLLRLLSSAKRTDSMKD